MKERKLLNGSLVLYTSTKELPTIKFHLFNKFIAQDNGIGADMDAVSRHYAKFDTHLAVGDVEALKQERINLHYCFHLMFNDVDLKSRAMLCYIHSINGYKVGDLNDEMEVEKCMTLLDESGCTIGDVEEVIEEIKKKWMGS